MKTHISKIEGQLCQMSKLNWHNEYGVWFASYNNKPIWRVSYAIDYDSKLAEFFPAKHEFTFCPFLNMGFEEVKNWCEIYFQQNYCLPAAIPAKENINSKLKKLTIDDLQNEPFTKDTYRKLVRKNHPDKNKLNIETATENMKLINEYFKGVAGQ